MATPTNSEIVRRLERVEDNLRFISRTLITGFIGLGFSVVGAVIIFVVTK